ncbi:MAG: signal peptidase II [Treponema sp.]|nr:signal peptidase II [Treponema sp.]MCL2273052.1 signal peptidase II [Treponema sp.]
MILAKEKCLPLSLTAIVILLDQITKAIIVKIKPEFGLIRDVFNNDLLWIYHVRNKAIAFSIGDNLPDILKLIVFIIVPILVLAFLLWYYLKTDEFKQIQRWAAAGIIGGGLGNIIDRIFRSEGVVDFISVRFFGFLGMERFPTFNIADSAVVVCCLFLLVTMFFTPHKIVTAEKIPVAEDETLKQEDESQQDNETLQEDCQPEESKSDE